MSDIDLVKQKIDIVDFIGQYLELKKAGSNHKALCPFHDENTSSFMVSAEKQIFKCFGCGEGGNVFNFLMKYENLGFGEALKILAQRAGVTLTPRSGSRSTPEPIDHKTKLYKINSLASSAFHKILTSHPSAQNARDYLKKRGVTQNSIDKFFLGYAPLRNDWLEKFLRSRAFSNTEISQAGAPNRFINRLMFPLSDMMGNVVGFTGRALDDKIMPKYLNTAETPIFYKSRLLYGYPEARQSIREKKFAIVVEGQMDVIMAHQAGTANTVASSGTALTDNHLKILSRITSNLILALDQDEAGQKASAQIFAMAQKYDFNLKLARYPENCKDPGELIARDPKLWRKTVKNALYYIEWLLEKNLAKYPEPDIAEKKLIFYEILPSLKVIADPIEQNHFISLVAKKLNTPTESIALALDRVKTEKSAEIAEVATLKGPSKSDLALGILSLYPEFDEKYNLYKKLAGDYNKDKLKEFELLAESKYQGLSQEELTKEIEYLAKFLKKDQQEETKKDFARQIADAETKGDRQAVKELLKKLQQTL